jgi:carboxyl-terminal processing protease
MAFENQRQEFAAERRKQYEEAVADVNKLIDAGQQTFAIDAAGRAYLLADDKQAFHDQQWVKDLLAKSVTQASEYEALGNWIGASRVYQYLNVIEPANPQWKDKLKLVSRRIRLSGIYAPDAFKATAELEVEKRRAADQVLKPTTQPTTKPTEETNDSFKIVWRDTVKGIQMEMLRDALRDSRRHYWRSVTYKDLLTGGLEGLRALATTPGLDVAFPKLADEGKREQFVAAINQLVTAVNASQSPTDDALMTRTIAQLYQVNRESIELPEEVFTAEFADGAFSKLDDFTNMIWPYDVEEFNKSTQGEFQGIGIQIDIDENGGLKVVSPIEDTPAYRIGIKAGDVITHINGKNAKGITINQAVKNITGPEGTSVKLTVKSGEDGTSKEYEIKREKIMVASIKGWFRKPGGGWDYLIDKDNAIGYARMTNFTKSTSKELDAAMKEMKAAGAQAVILDLRYNPGGLLNAATEVSDRFLSGGRIVSTKSDRRPEDEQVTHAHADGDDVKLPMVVLVNQYSASASEIVSGALRDQNRALVVGERTFGKGSVQMLFQVDGRMAFLKLTTSHYYLPNGECIHREENSDKWGVEPDVTVTMTSKQMSDAIEARQKQDILRDAAPAIADNPVVADAVKKSALDVDPQLSAAVLLLKLQLAGAKM